MTLFYTGINTLLQYALKYFNGNKPTLLVLCYHSIDRHQAALFEKQLDYLTMKSFHFLSGKDVTRIMTSSDSYTPNAKYVCLTFDDCYEDNYSVVRKILLCRGIPAIFFAPSRKLGTVPVWVDSTEQCRIMSKEQLIEMAEHFDIGAHSRHHVRLGEVDKSRLSDEISGSKADLEILLGKKIYFFAFPNGSYNSTVLDLVNTASFQAAFTIEQHVNYSFTDKYRLGRYLVNPDDYWDFKLKASGGYDWFYYSRKLLKNILQRWS